MGTVDSSSLRLNLKIVLIVASVCVSVGFSWILWLRGPGHRVTDRELLLEAVFECKKAGEDPPGEIVEQLAGQGYYDDAETTGKLFSREDSRMWAIKEVAKLRAENGDAEGAKRTVAQFTGSPVVKDATRAIALAQAEMGDQDGALDTAASLDDEVVDEILQIRVNEQLSDSDLVGVLNTSNRMRTRQYVNVFYSVGDVLRERHQTAQARKFALNLTDEDRRKAFVDIAFFKSSAPHVMTLAATPCMSASFGFTVQDFAKIDAVLIQNKCEYVAYMAERQYDMDPAGAERLLHSEPMNSDRIYGLNRIAIKAAKKGEIKESLRLYGDIQNLPLPRNVNNTLNYEVSKEIARNWTIRNGPRTVLPWVHSRPDRERVWALLGVAQALGHARPLKNQAH